MRSYVADKSTWEAEINTEIQSLTLPQGSTVTNRRACPLWAPPCKTLMNFFLSNVYKWRGRRDDTRSPDSSPVLEWTLTSKWSRNSTFKQRFCEILRRDQHAKGMSQEEHRLSSLSQIERRTDAPQQNNTEFWNIPVHCLHSICTFLGNGEDVSCTHICFIACMYAFHLILLAPVVIFWSLKW